MSSQYCPGKICDDAVLTRQTRQKKERTLGARNCGASIFFGCFSHPKGLECGKAQKYEKGNEK